MPDQPFKDARAALDAGDATRLSRLMDRHPDLVGYRCRQGEWSEAGYFQGATLLHHVAGNPIRAALPENVLDLARLLLAHGADPNATTDAGATTVRLLLTSQQASEAGVALPLIDLLSAAGAPFDLDDPELLTAPLLNAAPATAAALVKRGARADLRHAAGLGQLDLLDVLLAEPSNPHLLDEALAFACVRGQEGAVRLLLQGGARADVLLTHGGRSPCTALHEAANRGHQRIVALLIEHGADAAVVEPHWGGTPAGWAEHGGHPEIAHLLRQHLAGGRP
jgi:ankyrin repeat protein